MTQRKRIAATAAVAAALATMAAVDAQATTLVALSGDKTLVSIDAEHRRVINRVQVKVDKRLVGIDVRPKDRQLYGVVSDGSVVIINPREGSTKPKSMLQMKLPDRVRATIDFNPAADRLRMIGSDGTNLAANVDDGTVARNMPINFAMPNSFGGTTPSVIGGAYSNNVAGARATLLWDIDDATDALYLQLPPANGTLTAVGNQLGIQPGQIGFDIQTKSDGSNIAWLINGNLLHQVGLVSGLAKKGQPIFGLKAPVRDLAVLPSSSDR